MNLQEESLIACPYCGEQFTILLDLSIADQRYIEDCYVCCRPITVHVQAASADDVVVSVFDENDTA